MAEDREVLREIWEGRLPLCFQLADDELNTVSAPDPYYLMVPRLSYFPLVIDKVRRYFSRSVNPDHQDKDLWLEYGGLPLKWHFPIGVLFDLHSSSASLPWTITVHFQKFPQDDLLRFSSRESVEMFFLSCVKEADALKHRSQLISNMQKKDHNQLWMGLQNDKFDQFWTINRKLMESGEDGFKFVPVRVYIADQPYIQKPFRPVLESGQRRTLDELLTELVPDFTTEGFRAVIQGIEPSMETPVQWLSEHLSHPDNFLHVVLLPPT